MVDRPEPMCVPIEIEMIPLYREPAGLARLRRQQEREQRRENHDRPSRLRRVLTRLAAARLPNRR